MSELRRELTKLAHDKPELRATLVPLLKKHAGRRKDWYDGDRRAPHTPWGPAQTGYQLARGVWVYTTAGHGGMAVASGAARKFLTPAALREAISQGGYYWFEEDEAIVIPMYEVPDWAQAMVREMGVSAAAVTPDKLRKTLQRSYSKYLKAKDAGGGEALPTPPKVGDMLRFTRPVRFGGDKEFQPGDEVQVNKMTRSSILFNIPTGYGNYRMPLSYFEDGSVVKV